jgi:hypothetical protein
MSLAGHDIQNPASCTGCAGCDFKGGIVISEDEHVVIHGNGFRFHMLFRLVQFPVTEANLPHAAFGGRG